MEDRVPLPQQCLRYPGAKKIKMNVLALTHRHPKKFRPRCTCSRS
ncbi:unnamed protein product [Amoebophrya sp. A25]|nr:unnamed protein product [Amoebophrya sp. A25]|eukprot:GSA25T00014317001.1